MAIFKNVDGYAPLVANLDGLWTKRFDQLPTDLGQLVEREFFAARWDGLNPECRRSIAAQLDYQCDPRHEPAAYFELLALKDDVGAWIDKARAESKDSVAVALRDVSDRIEAILAEDRGRVGTEIQGLRELKRMSDEAEPPAEGGPRWPSHDTKKLTALRLAAVKFWSNYDPTQPETAPKNEAVIEWLQKEHSIGATPAAEMASILRPEALRTGPR